MRSVTRSVFEAPETREWRLFVGDMIECCEKVFEYTAGLDEAAFCENSLVYDATLRNIEIIGEAATRIPDVRTAHNPDSGNDVGTRGGNIRSYPKDSPDVDLRLQTAPASLRLTCNFT